MSFTSPLNLSERVSEPDTRVDFLPMFSVLLIALVLSFAGSQFIHSPGLTVNLQNDTAENGTAPVVIPPRNLELPASSRVPLAGEITHTSLTIFTAKTEKFFIFEGGIYSNFNSALKAKLAETATTAETILLKAEPSINMKTLFEIIDEMRAAGFKKIQIACETKANPQENAR